MAVHADDAVDNDEDVDDSCDDGDNGDDPVDETYDGDDGCSNAYVLRPSSFFLCEVKSVAPTSRR